MLTSTLAFDRPCGTWPQLCTVQSCEPVAAVSWKTTVWPFAFVLAATLITDMITAVFWYPGDSDGWKGNQEVVWVWRKQT